MKKLNSRILLESLQANTRATILRVRQLMQLDPSLLMQQPEAGRWSVAQVIEHLNTYGRYYLPEIEKAITHHRYQPVVFYKPGWAGDRFVKMMQPDENGVISNKMKTFKGHRPEASVDSYTAINEFLEQEQQLLELLEKAQQTNIGKLRVPISLTRFIKLKLGDTFRFFAAHIRRHFVQIDNTLKALETGR